MMLGPWHPEGVSRDVARPRAFDETVALEAAMMCFWEHGYESTSVQDLAQRMGIERPSLYNAFGGKRELFERALEHYCQTKTYRLIGKIESNFPAEDRIPELFAEVVDRSAKDRARRGCLLINSALEVSPHHPDLRRVIAVHLGALKSLFCRSLQAADGQSASKRDPRVAATNLVAVLLGLRVLARSVPERQMLEDVVAGAMSPLGLADAWSRRRRRSEVPVKVSSASTVPDERRTKSIQSKGRKS